MTDRPSMKPFKSQLPMNVVIPKPTKANRRFTMYCTQLVINMGGKVHFVETCGNSSFIYLKTIYLLPELGKIVLKITFKVIVMKFNLFN